MNSNGVKVSVIVPVYNIKNYIVECVESVIRQTYDNWECLLVDDGSTDGSEVICDKYEENNSKIVAIHKKNGGLSSARNKGIKASSGEYLFFIDGDDYISDRALEHFVSILENSYTDIVLGHMMKFRENSTPENFGDIIESSCLKNKNGRDAFCEIVKRYNGMMMGVRGLYKRDFITSNALFFDEKLRYSEDQDWTVRIFNVASGVSSNENRDYYYREGRTGSLMNSINVSKIEQLLTIYDRWFGVIKDEPQQKFSMCLYGVLIERYWDCFLLYSNIEKRFRKELYGSFDTRKKYINDRPKKYKMNYKMLILKLFPSRYIFDICNIWLRMHASK